MEGICMKSLSPSLISYHKPVHEINDCARRIQPFQKNKIWCFFPLDAKFSDFFLKFIFLFSQKRNTRSRSEYASLLINNGNMVMTCVKNILNNLFFFKKKPEEYNEEELFIKIFSAALIKKKGERKKKFFFLILLKYLSTWKARKQFS